jgi:hypothetical protein
MVGVHTPLPELRRHHTSTMAEKDMRGGSDRGLSPSSHSLAHVLLGLFQVLDRDVAAAGEAMQTG